MKGHEFNLFFALLLPLNLYAQMPLVILDSLSHYPVEHAQIEFSTSRELLFTNQAGIFSVNQPDTIIISAKGYNTRKYFPRKGDSVIFLYPQPFSLEEVKITSSFWTRNILEQPSAVSLLPKRFFDIHPSDPVILLNSVPGVYMQAGTINTTHLIIRGIGSRNPYTTSKVKIYLDDFLLTNGSGETQLEDVDWSMIKGAEIYKGPAPGVYGSGLGGTLVLHSLLENNGTTSTGISSTIGSWGLWQQALKSSWNNKGNSGNFSFSHLQQRGYRINNNLQRNVANLGLQKNYPNGTQIRFHLLALNLSSQIPSSLDSLQLAENPSGAAPSWLKTHGNEKHSRWMAGIRIQKETKNNWKFSSLFSFDGSQSAETRPFDFLDENRMGIAFRASLSRFFSGYKGRISIGAEMTPEQYIFQLHENIGGNGSKGPLFSNNRERMLSSSYYFQFLFQVTNRIQISSGASINSSFFYYKDLFTIDSIDFSGKYGKGVIPAPQLGITYLLNSQNSIFIDFSKGYILPSLSETLTETGIINPNIKPEISYNLETGVRGTLLNGFFQYNLNTYYMLINQLLIAERTINDTWIGKNAGKAYNRGVEAELSIFLLQEHSAPEMPFRKGISLTLSGTINDFRFIDYSVNNQNFSGNRLAGVPNWSAATSINYSKDIFFIDAGWIFTGSQYLRDDESKKLDPWSFGSTSAGLIFRMAKRWTFHSSFSCINLLNQKYIPMVVVNAPVPASGLPRYYYPGLPRHFEMQISIDLSFE